MTVPSLVDLATRGILRNLDGLVDVGDLPYDKVRSLLLKIENPTKLELIQKNSPQLIAHTGELWAAFIRRDIKDWQHKLKPPSNPANWVRLYRKLERDNDAEIARQQAALREQMSKLRQEKEANKSVIDETLLMPRRKRVKQAQFPPIQGFGRSGSGAGGAGGAGAKKATGLDRISIQDRTASAVRKTGGMQLSQAQIRERKRIAEEKREKARKALERQGGF